MMPLLAKNLIFVNYSTNSYFPVKVAANTILTFLRTGKVARLAVLALGAVLMSQCAGKAKKPLQATNMVVSVQQQKLALYSKEGKVSKSYPISTSKFGLGDKPGTNHTPLGLHEVVAKIGHGVRPGTVFKSRQPTGEVVRPNAPGRDPIVSRIMWLRGMEAQNRNAYRRCIYIHGTADEQNIGRAVSYGCVRMKSSDVMDLFNRVGIGSKVLIVQGKLPAAVDIPSVDAPVRPVTQPPIFLSPEPNARPSKLPPPPVQQAPAPQQTPPPAPQPQQQRTYETPVLASNSASIPSEAPAGFQSQAMANGAVIYTASGSSSSSSSRIVLKSRRHAQDSIR